MSQCRYPDILQGESPAHSSSSPEPPVEKPSTVHLILPDPNIKPYPDLIEDSTSTCDSNPSTTCRTAEYRESHPPLTATNSDSSEVQYQTASSTPQTTSQPSEMFPVIHRQESTSSQTAAEKHLVSVSTQTESVLCPNCSCDISDMVSSRSTDSKKSDIAMTSPPVKFYCQSTSIDDDDPAEVESASFSKAATSETSCSAPDCGDCQQQQVSLGYFF